MKRHLQGVAAALALLPTLTFAQSPAQALPASAAASAPGYLSAVKSYVRPAVSTSSPDKEWIGANRALREDGGLDMGGTPMGGMQMGGRPMDGNAMGSMPKGDKPMSSEPTNGMRMQGLEMVKPAASAPGDPHAGHRIENNGH